MPRPLRYIESGVVYEICFRAKDSLPLICYKFMDFMLYCILARVQRDSKVTLCHQIFNGSHAHILVIGWDSQQLINFYSEVQKKITDCLKCFLGLEHLEIWDRAPSLIKIDNLETAKDRIAYFYANPAQDDLEDSIEKFPGTSSWEIFSHCLNKLNEEVTKPYPWIRLKSIPKLSARAISEKEDLEVVKTLKERNKTFHPLTHSPNAWMRCFGIDSDAEVKQINEEILNRLRVKEAVSREKRAKAKKPVLGAKRLRTQPLLKSHTPKKRERKIHIITTQTDQRMEFIARKKRYEDHCRGCYRSWKEGNFTVQWPANSFKPPLPPTLNIFGT